MRLPPLALPQALSWSARLVALALALQTLELLQLRRHFADDGIWRFAILARDYSRLPGVLRAALMRLLPYRPFVCLLVAQLLCALAVLGCGCLLPVPLLLVGALLICMRFRGTFNGGSDVMTVVILLALSVAACVPNRPVVVAGCLGYIAVQTTLSYVIAGLTKLKEAQWRNGQALQQLLLCRRYAAPRALRPLLASRARLQMASLLVLGFECCFPLAWLDPRACVAMLALGALFHLVNAHVLGLNRFFFAWLASYPALLYFSQLAGR